MHLGKNQLCINEKSSAFANLVVTICPKFRTPVRMAHELCKELSSAQLLNLIL